MGVLELNLPGNERLFRLSSLGRFLFTLTAISMLALSVRAVDNCTDINLQALSYGWTCTFNPGAPRQLDIWCPWDDQIVFASAYINATRIVADTRQDFKYVITIKAWGNSVGNPVYRDELTASLIANNESSPELFAIGTRWLGYMQDAQLLYDVSDRWEKVKAATEADMISSVKNVWAPNDVWYSIPIQTDTMLLVYNKEAFAAMNVTEPPFQVTWDELYSLAKQVNSTVRGTWGFGLHEANAFGSRILFPLVHSVTNGNTKLFNRKTCLFNTPENIAAIETFTSMWTVDKVAGPTATCERFENDGDMPIEAIVNKTGGVAMMILAPGSLVKLRNFKGDLGVSALPRAFVGGVGLSISRNAPSGTIDAAFDIIKEFVDPGHNLLTAIANKTVTPPPIYPATTRLASQAPWNVAKSPAQAAFMDVFGGMDYSSPDYTLPYGYAVEEQRLFRCLMADIIEGRKSVAVAVEDLCEKVNTIIHDYCPVGEVCEGGMSKEEKTRIIFLSTLFSLLGVAAALVGLFFLLRCRRQESGHFRKSLHRKLASVPLFASKDLVTATDNFSDKNLLGSGAFGEVYSGVLNNGMPVAVKKLKPQSYDYDEEFVNEVKIINAVRHKNLVGLLGYCVDGDSLMLVYELVPNGSLEDALFGEKKLDMTWPQCFKVITGTADGISYLHTGCELRVIHRDIKPANILLDADFRVRVSDFGLAKHTNVEDSHVSTRVMGTLGYLDPSYGRSGQLTEKSDVYSYGMVLAVTLLGRKPFDLEVVPTSTGQQTQMTVLSDWVQHVGESALERVKERFPIEYNEEKARNCLLVSILCLQAFQEARPTMGQAVQMLKGEVGIPRVPLKELQEVHIPDYSSASASRSIPSSLHAYVQIQPKQMKGATYEFSAVLPR